MKLPLADDEEVWLHLHPHWKALVLPAVTLIVTCGCAAFLVALLPAGDVRTPARLIVVGLAVLIVLAWTVRPFLRWRFTSYALTNRRLITREGMLARHGHDLPLTRIDDVSFSYTLLQRLLGCGTLTVESAGERGQLELTDVPHVEVVQAQLYRLVEDEEARTATEGEEPPP